MFEYSQADKLHTIDQHARKDQRMVIRQKRLSHLVSKVNREVLVKELNSIPSDRDQAEGWFERMNDLALEVEAPLEIGQSILVRLYQLVRDIRSARAIETYKRVVALLCTADVMLIGQGTITMACELIERSAELAGKTVAIELIAAVSAKTPQLRNSVIASGALKLAIQTVSQHPQEVELSKALTTLYISLICCGGNTMPEEDVIQSLNFHIKMLQSRQGDMCLILEAIRCLAQWREPWLLQALVNSDIIAIVLDMHNEMSLTVKETRAIHRVCYIISELSDNYFETVRPETDRLLNFLLWILHDEQMNTEPNGSRMDVYFQLSNIMELPFVGVKDLLVEKGLIGELTMAVKRERGKSLVEVLIAVRSLANNMRVEQMEREFVKQGLLDALLDQVDLHLCQSEDVLIVMIEIMHIITESQTLCQRIDSRGVLRALLHDESRSKLRQRWEYLHYKSKQHESD